jgi:hypothetical protein
MLADDSDRVHARLRQFVLGKRLIPADQLPSKGITPAPLAEAVLRAYSRAEGDRDHSTA